ncbi:probable peroxisomal membrane protein PEX13 [Schistocerca gregaria]|uniref:probable peroxisomal membrane protein PEX13 n=1 Tax=Schistocerca gregaria TaxID=7010 RepID=UPI00211DB6D2|nr:probable peroxisomal membrane protein PEX13 [Schistocerca gregaria]
MSNPSPEKPWMKANSECAVADANSNSTKEVAVDKPRGKQWERESYAAPLDGHNPGDEEGNRTRKPWEGRPYQGDYYSGYSNYSRYGAYSNSGVPPSLVYGNYGCNNYGNYNAYNAYNGYGINNYGAYNGYNNGYTGPTRTIGWYGAADKGFQWVNGFHSITAGFGRFAGLLDANSQAMHGTLTSIVRLIESADFLYKEIGVLVSSITVFRLIGQLFRKLLGRHAEAAGSANNALDHVSSAADVREFTQSVSAKSRHKFLSILFFISTALFFGMPYLCSILKRVAGLSEAKSDFEEHFSKAENTCRQQHEIRALTPSRMPIMQVRALHDYHKSSNEEISMRRGDTINVFTKPFDLWWEGEIQNQPGVIGLFPANLTQPL